MDIESWLRALGLEQYEQAFRANDIDAEVLAELTADDLIGLGVTSIGHRRKLLAAIAGLRDGRGRLPRASLGFYQHNPRTLPVGQRFRAPSAASSQ